MQRTAGEGTTVKYRLDDNLWNCHIDPVQAEMALLNIVANARDAAGLGVNTGFVVRGMDLAIGSAICAAVKLNQESPWASRRQRCAARLLTFDVDPSDREPTVEVAHEALLRHWPRLRGWLDEDREALRVHRHLTDAAAVERLCAGVDGVICVDVPAEEDDALGVALREKGIASIRLATPTSDAARLPTILTGADGFLYYVSVAGITGQQQAAQASIEDAVARLKAATSLPVAVGFGVRTPEQAAAIGRVADGVVVGSRAIQVAADGPAARRLPRPPFHPTGRCCDA